MGVVSEKAMLVADRITGYSDADLAEELALAEFTARSRRDDVPWAREVYAKGGQVGTHPSIEAFEASVDALEGYVADLKTERDTRSVKWIS